MSATVNNAKGLGLEAFEYDVSDVLPGEAPWVQIECAGRVLFQGPADRADAYLLGFGESLDRAQRDMEAGKSRPYA